MGLIPRYKTETHTEMHFETISGRRGLTDPLFSYLVNKAFKFVKAHIVFRRVTFLHILEILFVKT